VNNMEEDKKELKEEYKEAKKAIEEEYEDEE